jgi:ATP-binding cassette subfamily B protein
MDNIRMGNPAATDEQVIEAAKAAQCHEFVEKLPEGYRTVIGTRGVHLSGGEKQRVAIARAIVKDAPIVVLDEATAFSDPENEHLIQKAFERLMKNKTVIMIAHRLSTVVGADNIIVIDKGRVAQSGTHEELLQQGGRYGDMWRVYTETASWRIAQSLAQPEKEGAIHG